jgi:hypothetical protein
MATTMHRLQISLPKWQAQYLAERAKRDGVSIAEIIRRLVKRESEASANSRSTDSLWELAGLAEDHGPLIDDTPVSESPELYVNEARAGRIRRRSPGAR